MEGLTNYEKVERPWGNFERFTRNEKTTTKVITITASESLSLQTHEHRDEFWRILQGSGTICIDGKNTNAQKGDDFFIPRMIEHRATSGPDGLIILEISFGDSDENDITRLEDKYGRV
jgi:mannose-1-phosphate guanylyltransferase/mannose-1-phosphate guanylyltransferase/mannose-6-phosphate isomerase